MLKRLSTVLLSAGLLLALTPAVASAAYSPYHHQDDSHYQCRYHCSERGYGGDHRDEGSSHYDRSDRYDGCRSRSRDQWGRYRYGGCRSDRVYHDGDCWSHDRDGWHRCGYRYYRYRY
jgi:hypothetical protein